MADTTDDQQEHRVHPAPTFVLTADHEAWIRKAAQGVLSQSFASLEQERVLPRSRYRPWIRIARDYFGHAVKRSEGPLVQAFEAALPERFERKRGRGVDLPWLYPSALLEAAVAAATLADEPYDVTSSSVQATIDKLIEIVQATPRAAVLQLVADVDVEHSQRLEGHEDVLGETIEVGGVRVIRVENRAERFIERELPSAGYEVERSQVVVHPGPASLLVASVESMEDYETRVNEARRRISTLIAAICLATGSTAHAVIDIAGEPHRIHRIHPSITPLPSWGYRFVHRPVTLSATDVPGLMCLVSLIGSWAETGSWVGVRIALGRLGRSLNGQTPGIADQVVDLAIGLEAALAGTDKTELSLRLRTRAAHVLATDADPPDAIYRDVKMLYDLRLTIVHGGSPSAKEVEKALRRVTSPTSSRWPAEQYLLTLDRWRDLLRRAILARIALATAAVPWGTGTKGGSRLDVDEFLLQETNRKAWREHIEVFWREHGLPEAPRLPPAARLVIGAVSNAAADKGSGA